MAGIEETRRVDEEIKARESLLSQMPTEVRKRVVELKAYPNEVVSRIKQINGVLVEFEQRA
jgi:hypothetical protein